MKKNLEDLLFQMKLRRRKMKKLNMSVQLNYYYITVMGKLRKHGNLVIVQLENEYIG